jgi:protein O-mannosyl-transferase
MQRRTPSIRPAQPPARATSRSLIFLAALIIALAAFAAYRNTFNVPFYFDDRQAITDNDSIKHLTLQAFNPPSEHAAGAIGRPLVNLSLAINYAISGDNVRSYHELNLVFHVLASWLLLGVLRRTLQLPPLAATFGEAALPLAFFIALLWSVHPLLTETVTCVVQRDESMVAIFYLLAFYCFVRSVDSPREKWWHVGAVAACFLGVAAKEVMVTAPLLVLLYDRALVAGTFRAAWAARRKFYAGMVASWIPLEILMLSADQRGGTVGFGLGMSPWAYALKQCQAIIHYLRLTAWPHPLVLDYGTDVVHNISAVWWQALLLLALLAGTGYALWKRPALGLAGAWVFVILAPSSSIVPLTTQTEAEHRMYLPLVALVTLVVLGVYTWAGRRSFVLWTLLALAYGVATFSRNADYRTELNMWTIIAKQRPDSDRAHYNLGCALIALDDCRRAKAELLLALKIAPNYADAHCNLGLCETRLGDTPGAMAEYRLAIQIDPDNVQSHYNLGCAYVELGKMPSAMGSFRTAAQLDPTYGDAQIGYGTALVRLNQPAQAIKPLEAGLKLDPDNATALDNYGSALLALNRRPEAQAAFSHALDINPNDSEAQRQLDALKPNNDAGEN